MHQITRSVVAASLLALVACTKPTAQSQDAEALRKEIGALKAAQAAMQKDIAEIRDFLKAATGGRFGAPRIEESSVDLSGAPARGQDSAPVTLVEVSDYHCPFCQRHFKQTQPRINTEYIDTGKVRHVFLHYPIDQLHSEAFRSHEGASCAAAQGKFWELHAKLFDAPVRTIDQIVSLASAAGLDSQNLRRCLEEGTYVASVRESVKRMQELGVDSTPTFLIGLTPKKGDPMKIVKVVKGAHPFEEFKSAIDPMLTAPR